MRTDLAFMASRKDVLNVSFLLYIDLFDVAINISYSCTFFSVLYNNNIERAIIYKGGCTAE